MSSFYSIPGPSGTIQIGTVTKLSPSANPTVTNVGTPEAAILNFGLPQGDAGTVSAAGAGSAAAPSITFAGDPNTGAFNPAADTWAVATGGIERLRIDSSGNVLIGTTTNTHSAQLVSAGLIAETVSGTQYPVVSSFDIGTAPNKIPINAYLGRLAFLDEVSRWIPAATPPSNNLDVNFEYVSDTSLKVRMRGADGTVRSATLTLS